MQCCEWGDSVRKPSVFHKHKLQVSHRRKCENPSLQLLEESIYKSDLGFGSDFLGKTPKIAIHKRKNKVFDFTKESVLQDTGREN